MTDWTLETAKHQLLEVCDYIEGVHGEDHKLENNAAFQWLCRRVEANTVELSVLDLNNVQKMLQESAHAVEEMRLIKALTADEGNSVVIHHPNPDFDGPNYAIDYEKAFDFEGRYGGETLLECLQQAAREHLPHE